MLELNLVTRFRAAVPHLQDRHTALKRGAVAVLLAIVPPPLAAVAQQGHPPAAPRLQAEAIPATSDQGRRLGTLIVSSLVAPEASDDSARPLVVVFNGGPGAASAWLQLGLLGSWQVRLPDDPRQPYPARPAIEPNRVGLWDKADLLFVDPLGTGFSRADSDVPLSDVRDWRRDGNYIARAVRLWMVRHHRQNAPVFLVGESYGAERAVAVADALRRGTQTARLSGMVLLSQTVVSEYGVMRTDRAAALALGLPTIAATACHFGLAVTPDRPDACAQKAAQFAEARYLPLLRQGADVLQPQRAEVLGELAGMTGLSPAVLAVRKLAVSRNEYRSLAFGGQRVALGLYDSRRVGAVSPNGRWQDPSLAPLLPGMADAARRYYRQVTGTAQSPVDGSAYVLFDGSIHATWRYGDTDAPHDPGAMAALLRDVLNSSGARLLVAGGLFDTVGGFGADRYLLARLRLPAAQASMVSYPGGHMFYLDEGNRAAFVARLRAFLAEPADRGAPAI